MADPILTEQEKKTAFNPESQPSIVGDFKITNIGIAIYIDE